jgi:hypothetical protein
MNRIRRTLQDTYYTLPLDSPAKLDLLSEWSFQLLSLVSSHSLVCSPGNMIGSQRA